MVLREDTSEDSSEDTDENTGGEEDSAPAVATPVPVPQAHSSGPGPSEPKPVPPPAQPAPVASQTGSEPLPPAPEPAGDGAKRAEKDAAPDSIGPARATSRRRLVITFRRTGDLERDKYRLREIYEMVRDPRGRDSFVIKIENGGHAAELVFPNDGCTITKRLESDLKRLKLEVDIQDVV
jgi:hypothetical protein